MSLIDEHKIEEVRAYFSEATLRGRRIVVISNVAFREYHLRPSVIHGQ